jgi:predicted dehydrogenase
LHGVMRKVRIGKRMKILIVGLGSIGRRHLRNLLALREKDILLYRTHQSTLPNDELGDFLTVNELEAGLAYHPEAVIISNPTALHMKAAIPAARAGCHIFLEKPISHSLEGIDELQAAQRSGGGQIFVGYQFRFHPGLQKVKALLSGSRPLSANQPSTPDSHHPGIGRPLSVRAHWGEYLPGWHPWEDYRGGYSARKELGGGVILTLCHPLDYLCWLIGEVESTWAFTGHLNDLDLDVEDTAEIGLRFANGALGSVHLDYNQRPSAHFLEIIGTDGTIRWANDTGNVSLYQAHTGAWEEFPTPEAFERNDLFLVEMQHFLAVARCQAAPLCTLEDGIRALRIALAARKSGETGQLIHLDGLTITHS